MSCVSSQGKKEQSSSIQETQGVSELMFYWNLLHVLFCCCCYCCCCYCCCWLKIILFPGNTTPNLRELSGVFFVAADPNKNGVKRSITKLASLPTLIITKCPVP